MTTLEQLIEAINSRKSAGLQSAFGIGVASFYVGAVAPCLSGGELCPVKLFKLASADLWQKEINESANRLTYCDKQMADPEFLSKSIREGADITKDAVLEYDCILSSKSKDRDGDVIHQKGGLEVDLKMPLLWQHIQVSPIGKHVALLDQDDTITKSRFAIANTELGRDAAVLVKFGALRKSIGFKPAEFSPIEIVKGADGKEYAKGWDIRKSNCYEGSLVSIPANADAKVISTYEKEFDGLATAHSRGLLKHAMIRHWAKGIYDLRPVQVQGASLVTKDASVGGSETTATVRIGGAVVELSTKSAGPSAAIQENKGQAQSTANDGPMCPKCGKGKLDSTGNCANCGHQEASTAVGGTPKNVATPPAVKSEKSVGDLTTKLYGNEYIDGSFEKIQSMLRRTASNYLQGKGIDVSSYSSYAELLATFDDTAIVCMYSYGSVKSPCYRMTYTKDSEGNATWTGEPAEVEVKQTVIEKHFATESLEALSRKLAAKMLTADGANAAVDTAHETISKAFATLKQSRESFDFSELFTS